MVKLFGSRERGQPFDAHSCCRVVFIEQDTFTSQKVMVMD